MPYILLLSANAIAASTGIQRCLATAGRNEVSSCVEIQALNCKKQTHGKRNGKRGLIIIVPDKKLGKMHFDSSTPHH